MNHQLVCFWIIYFKTVATYDIFGPEFKYNNGEYWGQSYHHDYLEIKIPHGEGTYVSDDKSVKFTGLWEHGEPANGTRFFKDGRNYTGSFKHSMLHGKGRISYQNGTILDGEFVNGLPCGNLTMTYANGDKRIGKFNQTWIGKAFFIEKGGASHWHEFWNNQGYYVPQVQMYQSVIDRYQGQVSVEVVCKIHSQRPEGELLKAGIKLLSPLSRSTSGEEEVATLRLKLDFSDDPFQTYTCLAKENELILAKESKQIRNPFFLMSYGDCGAQLAKPVAEIRVKRSVSQRVSLGHEQLYHGQVPWQALLWSDLQIPGQNISLDGFCGGTIISPYHILTAAHCLETKNSGLGKTLQIEDFIVKLGYNSQPKDPRGKDYKVKRIQIHPEFSNDGEKMILHNDIAMITLENRIMIDNYINPVCLPKPNEILEEDAKLTLSGFGLFYNQLKSQWEKPTFLQMTNDIQKLPISVCKNAAIDFPGYFCAGDGKTFEMNSNQFTADSCKGDSGGPLTYLDPHSQRFKLIGLVSWGSEQCGITRGSVYVNVTNYLPWIRFVKLMDAVDDYMETNGQLPYHKMDNAILHEMFKYISEMRD